MEEPHAGFREFDIRFYPFFVEDFGYGHLCIYILPSAFEYVGHESIEFVFVIGKTCRIFWQCGADDGAVIGELGYFSEYGHGHIVHVPVHEKDSVSGPAGGDKRSFL